MQLRGDDASDVTPGVSDGNAFDVYMVVRPKNNRGDSVILAVEQVVPPPYAHSAEQGGIVEIPH